jgi:hypothetical protein
MADSVGVRDIAQPTILGSRQPLVVPSPWLDGSFAAWLRERMTERGMTQRMLAMRSGVDHSTISRLLCEDRQPQLLTALALLSVLGVEPTPSVHFMEKETG